MKKKILAFLLSLTMVASYFTIPVSAADIYSALDLSKTETTNIKVGAISEIVVYGTAGDESVVVSDGVSFETSNEDVAVVDSEGTVTGIGNGVAIITATHGSVSKSIVFTVSGQNGKVLSCMEGTADNEIGRTDNLSYGFDKSTVTYPRIFDRTVQSDAEVLKGEKSVATMWLYDDGNGLAEMQINHASVDGKTLNRLKYGWAYTETGTKMAYFASENQYTRGNNSNGNAMNGVDPSKGWHQLVLERNGDVLSVYIDGIKISEGTADSTVGDANMVSSMALVTLAQNTTKLSVDDATAVTLADPIYDDIDITKVSKTDIRIDEEYQIDVYGKADDTWEKAVSGIAYTSSNESVATVDKAGKITGLANGITVVTASNNGISKSVIFTVSGKSANALTYTAGVADTDTDRTTGGSQLFTGGGYPGIVDTTSDSDILKGENSVLSMWFYDNGSNFAAIQWNTVAMSDGSNGWNRVNAGWGYVESGTKMAYISNYGQHTRGNNSAGNAMNGVEQKAGWHQLVLERNGDVLSAYVDGVKISESTAMATVGEANMVTSTALITPNGFYIDDVTAVTLAEASYSDLDITKVTKTNIKKGEEYIINVLGKNGGNWESATANMTFTSSNTEVAIVDNTGKITGKGYGITVITAKHEDISKSIVFTVSGQNATALACTDGTASIDHDRTIGGSYNFTSEGYPTIGNTTATPNMLKGENSVLSMWFYDSGSNFAAIQWNTVAMSDGSAGWNRLQTGWGYVESGTKMAYLTTHGNYARENNSAGNAMNGVEQKAGWHQLVLERNGDVLSAYVDGVKISESTATATVGEANMVTSTALITPNGFYIDNPTTVTLAGEEVTPPPATQYTVTATATNGTVSANGTVIGAEGAKFDEGTDVELAFAANAGYEIDTVTVNGQNVTLTDGKYTISAIAADTAVVASFKKSVVTGGTLSTNSAYIVYTPELDSTGKHVVFDMEYKPGTAAPSYRKYQELRLEAQVGTSRQRLFYFNTKYLTDYADTWTANEDDIELILADAISDGWVKIRTDLDLPNGKYKMALLDSAGEKVSESVWRTLPTSTISDWGNIKLDQLIVFSGTVLEGNVHEFKNMLLSEYTEPTEPEVPVIKTKTIYVSPDGSGYSGEEAAPTSLANVPAFVRGDKDKIINVVLKGGTYRVEGNPVYFQVSSSVDESRTPETPINFMPAEGAEVIIKGSKLINTANFAVVTADDANYAKIPAAAQGKVMSISFADAGITAADIKDINTVDGYSELYLNDKQQQIARWPNGENNFAQYTWQTQNQTASQPAKFTVDSAKAAQWAGATNAYMVGFMGNDYFYEKAKIDSISGNTLTLAAGSLSYNNEEKSQRYAVMNLIEELDIPGEWYADKTAEKLYYYPNGELTGTMELSTSQALYRIAQGGNINFKDITFAQFRHAAIEISGANSNSTIENCTFENMGQYGIYQFSNEVANVSSGSNDMTKYAADGSMNSHIKNNRFINIGKSGFTVIFGNRDKNDESSNSTVTGNYVYNVGSQDKRGIGFTVDGVGIDVSNNTVHQTGYGIVYHGSKINIHHNEVFDVMNQLDDGAAIYTGRSFINRGNKVYNNYIHDASAKSEYLNGRMNFGIYLDDLDAGTEVYGNIIQGASSGIFVNGGMSNNVHDNIVVDTHEKFSYANIGIRAYYAEGEAVAEQMKVEADKALANSSYAEFHEAIKADKANFDTWKGSDGLLLNNKTGDRTVGNIFSGNVTTSTKAQTTKEEYIGAYTTMPGDPTDDQASAYADDIVADNTFTNNTFGVATSVFKDYAGGDYRLLSAAANSNAPTKDTLDLKTIGIPVKSFATTGFSLLAPTANSEMSAGAAVQFDWERPVGADKFVLTIASDENFANVVETVETYETVAEVSGLEDGTYYWKVTANNESVNTKTSWDSSNVNAFTVGETAELPDTVTTKSVNGDNTVFTVEVNGSATNTSVVYVAVYDGGKLLEVAKTVNGAATIATGKLTGADEIRTFVWDMDNNLIKPLWEAEVQDY